MKENEKLESESDKLLDRAYSNLKFEADVKKTQTKKEFKRTTTQSNDYKIMSSLFKEDIEYPTKQLKGIPIISSKTGEIYNLYLTLEEGEYIDNAIRSSTHRVLRDVEIFDTLKKLTLSYLDKMFTSYPLEKRIDRSYDIGLNEVPIYLSFLVQMNDKLKSKPFVKEQMKNYRKLRWTLLKNFSFENKKKNVFKGITSKNNKETLDKIGMSFCTLNKNNEPELIDENNEKLKFLKKKISVIRPQSPINYKELIKQLFYKKLKDSRRELIEYCLEKDDNFSEDNFERFVCYIEFFTLLFCGIKVKYFIDELGNLNIDFYADEKNFMKMAEMNHYAVQFRIKDIPLIDCLDGTYIDRNNKKVKPENFNLSKEKSLFIANGVQFEEYDINNVENYPPFTNFVKSIAHNFRRYDSEDKYHICDNCKSADRHKGLSKIDCSSCFRHIDKARLLYTTINSIIDIDLIEKEMNSKKSNNIRKAFRGVIINYNKEVLEKYTTATALLKAYISPIETVECKRINKLFRNSFGEEIGIYYTWVSHYIKWLIFPAVLGLLVHLANYAKFRFINNGTLLSFNLFFACFIVLWGNFYISSWKQKEEICRYVWGMDTFKMEKTITLMRASKGTKLEKFMGIKIPIYNIFQKMLKKAFSLAVLFLSMIVVVVVNLLIFYIEKFKIYEEESSFLYSKTISNFTKGYSLYFIPVITFFAREWLSRNYKVVSKWMTDKENNVTRDEYKISLLKKQLYFEFFNYYFNLYYIAFGKRHLETCLRNDCFVELGNQLTIIVISDITAICWKIFYYCVYKRKQINKFQASFPSSYLEMKNSSKKINYFSRTQFDEENVSTLMLPIVMNFGYLMQFGSASPLLFFFVLCLVAFGRITNSISMSHLLYVNSFSESKGLYYLNKIENTLCVFGMFTNLCIIFYTNNSFIPMPSTAKMFLIIVIENFVFYVVRTIHFNHTPLWFDFKSTIEMKYLKKYGITAKEVI